MRHLTPLSASPSIVTPALDDLLVPTVRRRTPYAVERYPSVNGGVFLIGYDGRGDIMIEVRMSAKRFKPTTMERMRRWLMKNDESEPTPLALVE